MARCDSSEWLSASKIWKAPRGGSEWLSVSKIDNAQMPSAMAVNGPMQTKKGSASACWQQWPQRDKQQSKQMAQREFHSKKEKQTNKHGEHHLKRGVVGKKYDLGLLLLSE